MNKNWNDPQRYSLTAGGMGGNKFHAHEVIFESFALEGQVRIVVCGCGRKDYQHWYADKVRSFT